MAQGEDMDLDRAAITGQAFSTSIEGYDRDEVQRHLEAIADALEAAQLPPVGASAGEKLREIVEGAERSAEALQQAAAEEARSVSEAARQEAEALRVKADEETATQLVNARTAVKGLLERVEALHLGIEHTQERIREAGEEMARRLAAGAEPVELALRERAEALGAELDLMGSGLGGGAVARVREQRAALPADGTGLSEQDLEAAAAALEDPVPAPSDAAPAQIPGSDAELLALGRRETGAAPAGGGDESPTKAQAQNRPDPPAGDAPADRAAPADGDAPAAANQDAPAAANQDAPADGDAPADQDARPARTERTGLERARLVALNMALAGSTREETEEHLRAKFGVEDPRSILDEVYARAESTE